MAIERYAVGLSGHRDTFCRLLEFQTTDLGSIKGGSSRKLIIYKHKDKPGWYFDPSYPDVESASEHPKFNMAVMGFRLAARSNAVRHCSPSNMIQRPPSG